MKKILIINPFGIGDVLFTTPVIKAIKDSLPNATISYWCNERVKPVLENNKNIDKVFALSRGDIKKIYSRSKLEGVYKSFSLLQSIKKEKFELAFDFSLDHRYSLLSKFIGIKKRIGFNYKNRGMFLTDKIDIDGYNNKYVVEYYLDLLKFINIKPKIYDLDLSVSEHSKTKSKNILDKLGVNDNDLLIGIAPGAGASWGKDACLKHWTASKFVELADKIIKDYNAKILILGDESERYIADTIVKETSEELIDLVGKTSLEELISIISNIDILIANDGGTLHIAVALGKKTISFFGPVDPKVYGPYPPDEKRHIVLKKTLECSPCYRNFRLTKCQKNRACLEEISVEQALDALSTLL
jgi:lipopolysaccharide heptosyltransferase II